MNTNDKIQIQIETDEAVLGFKKDSEWAIKQILSSSPIIEATQPTSSASSADDCAISAAMSIANKRGVKSYIAAEIVAAYMATMAQESRKLATAHPSDATAVQSGELPAPRRYFHTLPLGTAFSYIGSDEKWIVLETHGCGLVAKYAHHDSNKPLQQICSFEDSEYAAQHTEVDVVQLEAIAQTAQAVAGEAWISVKDKLPELHSFVLVSIDERYCDTDFDVLMASYTMKRNGNGKVFTMSGGTDYHPKAITHWMPMPAAPSQGAKQ